MSRLPSASTPGRSADEAAAALAEAGQPHLVEHARTLPERERASFLAICADIPWQALKSAARGSHPHPPELRQPKALTWRRQMAQGVLRPRLRGLGEGLLRGGRVAALLLAGGQGTRLGVSGPKGNVVFGPDAGRTLYRIHGERVAAASERAGRPVPLVVLVSPETEDATREAFEEAPAWGLARAQLHFLVQQELPCLDAEGRALLAGRGLLASAPDGHGGAFGALARAGLLEHLVEEGVDVLTTFQVDNPLGRPLDPVMLGWMVERRLQAVGKAVRRLGPDEKVGIFARDLRGRLRVVEYSELPQEPAADAPPQPGEAVSKPLDLGSIAIHGFSLRWLRDQARAGLGLPLHRAFKRVRHLDAGGAVVEPAEPNAWKLERFLFDLFPLAERAEVHEVNRAWEFAPVKNARGRDSLDTARALVAAEVLRWHAERGLAEPQTPTLSPREVDGGAESL